MSLADRARDVAREPKYLVQRALNHLGYRVERAVPPDVDAGTREVLARVRPYTMTSVDAVVALCSATEHVCRARVPGAFVECGVWRGGSMLAVALTLLRLGVRDRDLFLFDTFAGMPPPGDHDVRVLDGLPATNPASLTPAIAVGVGEVRALLRSSGYPPGRIHLVEGPVERTLPAAAPDEIALLRLDTDWYSSTRHELEHLGPRVSSGGILIVDDYGHWQGARRAVDEYIEGLARPLYLSRVDYTVRLAVVP